MLGQVGEYGKGIIDATFEFGDQAGFEPAITAPEAVGGYPCELWQQAWIIAIGPRLDRGPA